MQKRHQCIFASLLQLYSLTWGSAPHPGAVPPALFPGGRTEVVNVNLIPPGTDYLEQWNQLDFNLKRQFKVGRFEMLPSIDIFNLTNSSVVLTQFQAFGPSLGVPTSVLQGRFVKLSLLTRF